VPGRTLRRKERGYNAGFETMGCEGEIKRWSSPFIYEGNPG